MGGLRLPHDVLVRPTVFAEASCHLTCDIYAVFGLHVLHTPCDVVGGFRLAFLAKCLHPRRLKILSHVNRMMSLRVPPPSLALDL